MITSISTIRNVLNIESNLEIDSVEVYKGGFQRPMSTPQPHQSQGILVRNHHLCSSLLFVVPFPTPALFVYCRNLTTSHVRNFGDCEVQHMQLTSTITSKSST
jgi:hypothetical protein